VAGAGEPCDFCGVDTGDFTHHRYHHAQADPAMDTPAKRLARSAGVDLVKCGCGEAFPSAVIPP
jgi:hypothetical protein